VSLRLVSALFLAIVAVAVAEAAQVVGVLLVFALMVGPAATSLRLTSRVGWGVGLAVLLALVETWLAIALAYFTDWPTTFWLVLLSCCAYFLSLLVRPGRSRSRRARSAHEEPGVESDRLTGDSA